MRVKGLEPLNIWVCMGKNVILLVYLGIKSTSFLPIVGTSLAHCAKNTNQIHALWLAKIDRPLLRASALDLNPQACSDFSSLVGDPSGFRSGPLLDPMRTPKLPRRLLLPDFTGALRLDPGFSRS